MSKTTEIRQQVFTAPAAADNTSVHAAITLPSSGTTVVTTAITNPVNPRTIRLKGNQATVQGLVMHMVGTDWFDQAISEDVTMGGDYTVPTDTVNAYKTVTSITAPTRGASGDTVSVGRGAALGLDCYCDAFSFVGLSGTSAKTTDTAVISKNTATLSASLDGSTDQALNYIPSIFPAYGRTNG